jgi:hypothetical protein
VIAAYGSHLMNWIGYAACAAVGILLLVFVYLALP